MRQEQVSGSNGGGRHTSTINFRVDDELHAAIEAWAAEQKISRSEACRLLIASALGGEQAVIREGLSRFAELKTRLIGKLAARLPGALVEAIAEAEAEAAEEPS